MLLGSALVVALLAALAMRPVASPIAVILLLAALGGAGMTYAILMA